MDLVMMDLVRELENETEIPCDTFEMISKQILIRQIS